MVESLKPVNQICSLHNKLFKFATAEISENDARKRLNGKGNSFLFLAGHVVSSRYFMANLMNMEEENPLGDQFNGGFDKDFEYPSLDEVKSVFYDFAPRFREKLGEVDSKTLAGELPQPFPVEEQNILNGVTFLAEHEGYHIGQMGYLLVQLGYTSIYDLMFADS